MRVTLGDYTITVPDTLAIIGGTDIPGASFILMESKLPRAIAAVLAGASLAVAGAVMQDLMRNPWRAPTSSASAGVRRPRPSSRSSSSA
ncbi:iron chelate uptake ABC transporter family permease subunit [Janibacter sp. DB-40]|uniref:iron chelate uptake ABC transporter family permease subunit n=1 Tax=Janibacter sp. DB-40 TaxID=3028808 RepID=UPI0024068BA0|nr:iron chelate uptake ABC transporter family permease subunit [Janibacter sp. DB-40]